ncbi:transmembrane protein 8B [Exaiptasia diaphana]|uniref:Uncharacterized protein n=1 Tax=Exaiptasia diaphana TaxID=2652724 RepID=A0A913XYY5_EXADI|nr:transmembrane protein 8B [Exaiptasia diaphana]
MRLFPEMVVYMFLTIMSTMFHLCKTQIACVMDISFLQLCDFYAIILSIWVTLVAMASLSNASYTATLNMIAVLVLFVCVVKARESILPFVLTLSIGLLLAVVYHLTMWCRGKPSTSFSKKRWALFILPASILVTLCFLIFALFETTDQYKYVHSVGHVFLGIGIALLLPNHRHRISHYDVSRQLSDEARAQSVNSRSPLLVGRVRHV